MDPKQNQTRSSNFGTLTSQGQTVIICPTCSLHVSYNIDVCPNDGTVLSGTIQPALISNLAGQYEFLGKIGEGGMGVIYKARHLALNHLVAIKMMHVNRLDQTKVLRFQQEAKAVSSLDHPSIVRVRDFGINEVGQPHMVLDFIDGVTLEALIKAHGPLSLTDVKSLFVQICDAVGHAHQRKVLHRDLKPSNIMLVDRDNDVPLAIIVDFGIAKVVDPGQQQGMNLTQTGEVFGSPFYMSPEQTAGREIDLRSDIYSVGCVLYESLTGAPPFVGQNSIETLMMHTSSSPPTLKEGSLGKVFPDALQAVVNKALAKDPNDRFDSMAEFKHALVRAIDQTGNSPDVVFKKRTNPDKKKYLVAGCVGVLVIALGVVSYLAYSLSASTNSSAVAPVAKIDSPSTSSPAGTVSGAANLNSNLNVHGPTAAPAAAISNGSVQEILTPTAALDTTGTKPVGERPTSLIHSLDEYIPQPDDAAIANLKRDKDLTTIYVRFPGDKAMACFDDVHHATRVEILDSSIEGPGLVHLKNVPLKSLSIVSAEDLKEDALKYLPDFWELEDLSLAKCPIFDAELLKLNSFKKLRMLSLERAPITGDGLVRMSQCANLQDLDLSECNRIQERDWILLENFKRLNILKINGTKIERLTSLAKSTMSNLRELEVDDTPLSENPFKDFKSLPALERVTLSGVPINDVGLRQLAEVAPNLQHLELGHCHALRDSDLGFLRSFKKLKILNIAEWKVNSAGLKNLTNSHLTDLNLSRAKIKDGDLVELSKLRTLKTLRLTDVKSVTKYGVNLFKQESNCAVLK